MGYNRVDESHLICSRLLADAKISSLVVEDGEKHTLAGIKIQSEEFIANSQRVGRDSFPK